MTDSTPDYFSLLDLDPDAPWDLERYKQQLKLKQTLWRRLASEGVQSAVAAAERHLKLIPDIERVMRDEGRRERAREAARTQQARAAAAKKAEFDRTLGIMLEKGFLYDTEEAELRHRFPRQMERPEAARRLEKAAKRPKEADVRLPDRLDPTTAGSLRALLDELGEKSLYTLLATVRPGIAPDRSDTHTLRAAAEELDDQTRNTRDRRAHGVDERRTLAGHALAIFKSDRDRARYDTELRLQPLDDLLRTYEPALRTARSIDPRQTARFLNDARAAGIDVPLARAQFIAHFVKRRGWPVAMPSPEAEAALGRMVRCWSCEALTNPDEETCTNCREALRLTCPSCGTMVPARDRCGNCRFPIGDRNWVRALLDECDRLCRQSDLRGAEEKLGEAENAWSLPVGSTDELAVRIRRSEHELRRLQADQLCQAARRPGVPPERQADLYLEALAVCADHEEARAALRLLPPAPPRKLRMTQNADRVHIQWQPSPANGVRYVLVRKVGSQPPVSATDGAQIATVDTLSYDDTAPESGVPVHYAVFTERGGTHSLTGATAPDGAVFITGEAEITFQGVDDGEVELHWTLPPHAEGVQVWRSAEPAPAGSAEPSEFIPSGLGHLRARELRNRCTYTFTLRVRYRDPDNQERLSPGRSVSLTPASPPAPVDALHIATVAHRVREALGVRTIELRWAPPDRGTVRILHALDRPPLQAGDIRAVDDLSKYGQLLDGAPPIEHQLTHRGLSWFIPLAVLYGRACASEARRYAFVDELTDLKAENADGAIRVTWTWPQDCDSALVAYDVAAPPSDPTVARHQDRVGRRSDERDGSHEIGGVEGAAGQKLFIVAAAVCDRDGEAFVSSGVHCSVVLPSDRGAAGWPGRAFRRRRVR